MSNKINASPRLFMGFKMIERKEGRKEGGRGKKKYKKGASLYRNK